MRIRMLVQLSGPSLSLDPGDEHEFQRDEAIRLITAGFAVPVAEIEIQRAVLPPPQETRMGSVLKLPEASDRERAAKRGRR